MVVVAMNVYLFCAAPTTCMLLHCVPKNIPDIFDCNLKTSYQILIIFGIRIFLTRLAIKRPFSFLPHPIRAFALPRESRSSEMCVEMNSKPEKNIPTLLIVT